MIEEKKSPTLTYAGALAGELVLARWRAEIARMRGAEGVEWALRMARLETSPSRVIELMTQYLAEIPEDARPVFMGARARLLAHTYTAPAQ